MAQLVCQHLYSVTVLTSGLAKLAELGIKWRYNTPTASNQGGLHERSILSSQTLTMAISRSQVLSYQGFYTLLCGVEQIMNFRPICSIDTDPMSFEVLTPEHFINARAAAPIMGGFNEADAYRKS